VELVKRFYKSWTARELDRVLECVDTEIRLDWSDSRSPFRGVYEGREGLLRFWTDTSEAWDEFSLEVEDVIECERERVVAATVVRGRGAGSGIDVEARGTMLWTMRHGRLLEGRLFQTIEEALEAAALTR
jgi:ketosteroid isomerase-like protein